MATESRGTHEAPAPRRPLRWLGVALGALAAGTLAAGLALSWGWRRDGLRAALERALSSAVGGTVQIGALEGRLYPDFTLRALELSTPRGPLLTVDSVEARLLLRPLVTRGVLAFETLAVDGADVSVDRDAEGWSFGQLASGDGAQAPGGLLSPAIELGSLRVRRGTLRVRAQGPPQSSVSGRFELSAQGLGLSPAGALREPERAELSLELDPSRIAGRELRSAALRVRLDGGRLEIRQAELDSSFGRAHIDGQGDLSIFAQRRRAASARLAASFEELDLGLVTGRPELASTATGTLELAASRAAGARPGESEVSVAFQLEPSHIAATGRTAIELRGRMQSGRWTIDAARVESEAGALRVEGGGDIDGVERIDAHAELRDLAAVDRLLPGSLELVGRAVLEARVQGAWRDARAEVELQGSGVRLRGVELGEVRAAFATRGAEELRVASLSLQGPGVRLLDEAGARVVRDASGIDVRGLDLAWGDGRLALSGRIEGEASDLRDVRVETRNLDVAALAALAGSQRPVAGRLSARLSLDGSLPLPRVDGEGTWEAFRFGQAAADRLRFEAATTQGRMRASVRLLEKGRELLLARADLPWSPSRLDLASLLRSPDARLDLVAEELHLDDLAAALPLGVRQAGGRAHVRLALRGGRPLPTLEGELSVTDARVVRDDGWSAGPVDGRVRVTGETLDVDELRVATDSGPLLLRASAGLAPLGPESIQLRVGRLALETPWGRAASEGEAVLVLDPRGVSIERLRLVDGARSVAVRGRVEPAAVRDLRVEATAVELEPLSRLLGLSPPLGGSATASFRLDGPLTRPAVAGNAEIAAASYGSARADGLRLELEVGGGLARGSARAQREGREVVSLRATLPYVGSPLEPAELLASPETELELRAEDFDLAWAAAFAPRSVRQLSGRARGWVRVKGARPEPDVEGELQIEEASFQLPAVARTVSSVSGRAHMTSRAIQIEYVRIGTGEREAAVQGRIELVGGLPSAVDLVARFEQFQIAAARALRAQLDGQVTVTGPIRAMVAQGRIDVSDARVSLPEPEDRLMREIRVLRLAENGAPVEATGTATDVFDRAALDLAVSVPENTWIVGRGASLEVKGDLRLVKEPLGEARYLGALQVVRGQWRLHGRTFVIQQGVAAFTGSAELDPEVHVLALHRVRDVTIVAMISGRASEPQVTLASNPSMDQTDVLSYLVFGRRARDLGEAESTGLQRTAAIALGGVAASRLTEALREHLPVDTVDVGVADSGSGARIGVGRYITPDVFVRYGQTIGAETEGDVDVEWKVTDEWSLESEVTTAGTAGVDLIWNLDY